MSKRFILLIFLAVVLFSSVVSAYTLQNTGYGGNGGGGATLRRGMVIQTNDSLIFNITGVQFMGYSSYYNTLTTAYIMASNGTIVATCSTGGAVNCTFSTPYQVLNNSVYYILADKGGAAYTGVYDTGASGAFPLQSSHLKWLSGYNDGNNVTGYTNIVQYLFIDNIANVTPPATPNASVDIITLLTRTPSDLTGSSAFGYPQINFTYYYFNTTNITTPYLFNYTLNRTIYNCVNWINGTCNLANRTWAQANASYIANNSNSSKNVTFTLTENELFSFTANYDFYGSTGTSNVTLGASDWHKETFLNFSTSGNYTLVFESPTNTTGLIRIYLANDSYTEGLNPQSDANVAEICSILSTDAYNHTHGTDLGHRLCFIQVTNGKYNNMQITNNMSVLTALVSGSATIPTINQTVRTGSARYTANNGATWSESYNQRGHVHVFHASDTLFFQAFGNVSTGGSLNSTLTSDNLALTEIPPNNPTITNPIDNANTNASINITWTSAGTGVLYNVTLLNSDLTTNKTLNTSTSLTYYNWNIYSETQAYLGQYYVRVLAYNANGTADDIEGMNITRNARVNITARTYISNSSISNFSGWVYQTETGLNTTYSTTSATAFAETLTGNITIYIDAPGYATNNSFAYKNTTSAALTQQQFYLWETNTVNITFYLESSPTTIVNTTTISAEFIGSTYLYWYNTTNGTIYATLLQPDSYNIRYTAAGYSDRFYAFTLTNRTVNILNLYMMNTSTAYNVTVSVIDVLANPITDVYVHSLKYNPATGTYQVQEVKHVNSNGEAVLGTTFNDEFWKFMVVDETGEILKTTEPDYITSNSLVIQIESEEDYATELNQYGSISYDLSFNQLTNNMRLDYAESTGFAEEFLLVVYVVDNASLYLFNTTSDTSASGTLLITLTPINGTTYAAYSYYKEDGVYKYLSGLEYTYGTLAQDTWGNMGIFAQILLTLGASSLAFASPVLGVVLSPITLIIGAWIGWIDFTATAMASYLLLMGIILAVILSVKR